MTIINSSRDLTPKETYLLTKAVNVKKISDNVGNKIQVEAWVIYEDIDKKDSDKINEILSITDGKISYATNSPTFIESFLDITSIFGLSGFTIEVDQGTSKAGRNFVQCVFAD